MIPSLLLFFLAAVPVMWKDWLYSRPVTANNIGLVTFVCPRLLYDHAGSRLADLRLINSEGVEVPFALQKRPPHTPFSWRPAKFLKGPPEQASAMEVTLDTGEQNHLHNVVSLDIPETDFLVHVELSASDLPDHDWHLLRSDGPIYRYKPDGLQGNQTIGYPENYSRYLKLKLTAAPTERAHTSSRATIGKPFHLLNCQVAYDDSQPPEWSDFSPVFLNEPSTSEMQSWFRADAQIDSLPVTGIRITTTSRGFHRALKIATSNDGRNWTEITTSDIYRTMGEEPAEKLIVETPESRGRYWRVMFYDNGEPPLTIERIVLLGVPYHVVFQAMANTQYHLLYGNGKVPAPQYDMGRVLPPNAFQTAGKASIGDEELDTVLGHGWKFWTFIVGGGVLVVAAVVLLLIMVASEG